MKPVEIGSKPVDVATSTQFLRVQVLTSDPKTTDNRPENYGFTPSDRPNFYDEPTRKLRDSLLNPFYYWPERRTKKKILKKKKKEVLG